MDRELVRDTRSYLQWVPQQTQATSGQLHDIMMAQDFQDLTGQVIKKLVVVIRDIEKQLIEVLLRYLPEDRVRGYEGERREKSRENSSLLSNVCEAVIAALYQDGGLEVARAFVEKHWAPLIEENPLPPKDAKTALQEWAQGEGHALPFYTETGRDGPDHNPVFTVEVAVNGLDPASGRGRSKRVAEQAAAATLIKNAGLGND